MVTIMSITLLAGGYMGHRSFERGFIGYVNNLQGERLEYLAERLQSDFSNNGSWAFLSGEQTTWTEYLSNNESPTNPSAMPKRGASSQYQDNDKNQNSDKNQNNNRGRRGDDRVSREARYLSRSLSLFDKDGDHVAGNTIQSDSGSVLTPLLNEDVMVGQLRFQPFAELTESLDRSFAEQRKKSFLFIGAISILFTAFASWLFSTAFSSNIKKITTSANKMAGGDYGQRIKLTQRDEIGQLAESFNVLSKTLEENQTSRQRWIADISHELRTPLAVLRGELEALEDGVRDLTPEAITSLNGEVTQLNKLVGDLYELSLSDIGALNYQMFETTPATTLSTIFNNYRARFEKAKIESHLDVEDDNTSIMADEARLTQLFTNLLENSIRYTDAGGKTQITCRVKNDHWEMQLQDSAPGVDEVHIPHLFERLYRTDDSRNRKTGGAGLGLAIVSEIVKAHDGSIEASPSELGGLNILLKLPLHHD